MLKIIRVISVTYLFPDHLTFEVPGNLSRSNFLYKLFSFRPYIEFSIQQESLIPEVQDKHLVTD